MEDHKRFIKTLKGLMEPRLEGRIESSALHQTGVDLLDWYEVQNMFHEYFTDADFGVACGVQLERQEANQIVDDHLIVLRGLKVILHGATSVEYFCLTDCLYSQIYKLTKN